VLRFWETEFPQLSLIKEHGQRMYRRHEVECALRIKRLLYQRIHHRGRAAAVEDGTKTNRSQAALPFAKSAATRVDSKNTQGLKEVLGYFRRGADQWSVLSSQYPEN